VERASIIYLSAPRSTRRKASGGVILFRGCSIPVDPPLQRAVSFIDAQNLLHSDGPLRFIDGDDVAEPRYLMRPFPKEPHVGVTSVNYSREELLTRGGQPA
jgi:hypothetical protein